MAAHTLARESCESRELRRLPPLPAVTLRNIELEQRLDALLAVQGIVTVAAPLGSGKSTAVSSWLRNSSVARYPTWIESTLDPDDRADVVAQVREIAHKLCGENLPKLEWGTAPHRRAAARALAEHMTSDAIFVVHRPAQPSTAQPSPAQQGFTAERKQRQSHETGQPDDPEQVDRELFELIVECDRLSLVIIENIAHSENPDHCPRLPTIGLGDLALSASALHREAERLAAPLTEPVSNAIVHQFAGSPVIAAAYFEAIMQNPALSGSTALQQAKTDVLMDVARSTLGAVSAPALAMLAVLESTTSVFLAKCLHEAHPTTSSADYPTTLDCENLARVAEALESLSRRGLITVTRTDALPPVFSLPPDMREHVRARTITHYLDNRVAFHVAASEAFRGAGETFQAVRHLLLADRVEAALTLFCASWDSIGREEFTTIRALFDRDSILSSLEAVAVCWLVGRGDSTGGGLETALFCNRLGEARITEVGALELRARLTVRSAMTRVLLEENRLDEAEAIVADATSDLHRASPADRRTLGGSYTEHLLASAQCALIGGDLFVAHRLFEGAGAAARASGNEAGASRASLGLALCSIFNAQFDVAQRHIDQARVKPDSGETELAEAWAKFLLWGSVGAAVQLHKFSKELSVRSRSDTRWRALSQLSDAALLAGGGNFASATNTLRSLAGLTLGGWQQPLFQQSVHAMLALMSMLSNQPGTGFAALSITAPSENHVVCFNAFRALLEAGRGDPAAALRATDECLVEVATHAKLMLPYVYLSRSIAFGLMARTQAAADALAVSTALANASSQRILFAEIIAHFTGSSAHSSADVPAREHRPIDEAGSAALTPKEREVLAYLGRDETLSAIATSLFVSDNTLKSHTRSIYRKLGVSSRSEATDRGALWGVL